jgi:hypothetical protein
MSMIDNEAQDKTHDAFMDRTQERPERCIILENAYKINVTFRHQPNPIFNSTTYSRQVWDRRVVSTQHYFSFSQAAAPDVLAREEAMAKEANRQLDIMKDFTHKNAKQFANMNDAVHKEFEHMDKQLAEIKMAVYLAETDTMAFLHHKYTPSHCSAGDVLIRLVKFDISCITSWNPFRWLRDLWHYAVLILILVIAIKLLSLYCRHSQKKSADLAIWKLIAHNNAQLPCL